MKRIVRKAFSLYGNSLKIFFADCIIGGFHKKPSYLDDHHNWATTHKIYLCNSLLLKCIYKIYSLFITFCITLL